MILESLDVILNLYQAFNVEKNIYFSFELFLVLKSKK